MWRFNRLDPDTHESTSDRGLQIVIRTVVRAIHIFTEGMVGETLNWTSLTPGLKVIGPRHNHF